MGKGFTVSCSECEYCEVFYLGAGFYYPYAYASTMLKARRGKYGKELKKLLKAHPDAAIDPTLVLTSCPKCHALCREENLSAYLPKLS